MIMMVQDAHDASLGTPEAIPDRFRHYYTDLYALYSTYDEEAAKDYLTQIKLKWLTDAHRENLMARCVPKRL